jgi:hypothetical protein
MPRRSGNSFIKWWRGENNKRSRDRGGGAAAFIGEGGYNEVHKGLNSRHFSDKNDVIMIYKETI